VVAAVTQAMKIRPIVTPQKRQEKTGLTRASQADRGTSRL